MAFLLLNYVPAAGTYGIIFNKVIEIIKMFFLLEKDAQIQNSTELKNYFSPGG